MADAPIQYDTINKYDRLYGGMREVGLMTKPSAVKVTESITGRSETFVVQTARHAESGDYIFIERMDENGVTRIVLPPKVAKAIASHRNALTARRRSIHSKAAAKARKDRGELPGFMRKK